MATYVLIDRDGVINVDSDQLIKLPMEWRPIPGSLEIIAFSNRHDFGIEDITISSGLPNVYSIGNSLRGIQAGLAAYHHRPRKDLAKIRANQQLKPPIFENLYEATRYIVSKG